MTGKTGFLDLSCELRAVIFEHLLVPSEWDWKPVRMSLQSSLRRPRLHVVAAVPLLWQEILEAYYKVKRFHFPLLTSREPANLPQRLKQWTAQDRLFVSHIRQLRFSHRLSGLRRYVHTGSTPPLSLRSHVAQIIHIGEMSTNLSLNGNGKIVVRTFLPATCAIDMCSCALADQLSHVVERAAGVSARYQEQRKERAREYGKVVGYLLDVCQVIELAHFYKQYDPESLRQLAQYKEPERSDKELICEYCGGPGTKLFWTI